MSDNYIQNIQYSLAALLLTKKLKQFLIKK